MSKMVQKPRGKGKRLKAGTIYRCDKDNGCDNNTIRRNRSVLRDLALILGMLVI